MAKPPINPLKTIEGKEISYFQKLMDDVLVHISKDGITLNFEGYTATLIDYANLKENELNKAWQLTKELNAWSEYFSSIANLIQKVYLDAETEKLEVQSTVSIRLDETKVSNGDRLSNKDEDVIHARKKRNALKAFHDELESKIEFLGRAYYHCKATCDWAHKSTPQQASTSSYSYK